MDDIVYNRIFALDIGTRYVVGVLGTGSLTGDVLEVTDMETIEHSDRSMFNGQIHDIEKVTCIVKQVRKKLENRNGCQLRHVSLAAAGRALITNTAFIEEDVTGREPADRTFISSLELKAMQKSQQDIQGNIDSYLSYFCVGYSVVNYYLDGMIIKNLEGHRGNTMGVEIISTFLPRTVVDSLYSVIERAGLEVASLTLEPIAAISMVIPESLRLLNLAMVDIGAGTSDIAITRDGSIKAYAMVPQAGDGISESIARYYMTDFNTAERIKIEAVSGADKVIFTDVLGNCREICNGEVLEVISPTVETLAQQIADRVLRYNQGPPSALFCIGGGSRIPGIKRMIANKLGISEDRVAVKKLEEVEGLKVSFSGSDGPEAVTPVGIALAGFVSSEADFINVFINGNAIRLLNTKTMTITDVLLAIGFNPRRLIPSRGPSVKFKVNGKQVEIKGKPGEPAVIMLNGKPAGLDAKLTDGDVIQVKDAVMGEKAEPTVAEVIQNKCISIIFEGNRLMLAAAWMLNGEMVSQDTVIRDEDVLEITPVRTLEQLISIYGMPTKGCIYRINDEKVGPDHILADNDRVDFVQAEEDEEVPGISIDVNKSEVVLPYKESPYIFVDLFNYIDFDFKNPRGRLRLTINGNRAGYTDIINDGDSIIIGWER